MKAWALLIIAAASPGYAQIAPVPTRDDPRIQTVRFVRDQPVRLQTSPGSDLTVMLDRGERIADITVSNHATYQVTLSEARDSFILHTSMVLYQGAPKGAGDVTISTDRRTYELALSTSAEAQPAYVLRFTFAGSQPKRNPSPRMAENSQYRLTGNKELRPASVRDDGAKTYIEWAPNQPIPAVFALDRLGREEMVDGHMREGVFTLDRVHDRLVFRIDDAKAEALRPTEKSRQ